MLLMLDDVRLFTIFLIILHGVAFSVQLCSVHKYADTDPMFKRDYKTPGPSSFKYADYVTYFSCGVVFESYYEGDVVEIQVLEANRPIYGTCEDMAVFYDGYTEESPILYKLCGNPYGSAVIVSTGRAIYMTFRTDEIVHVTYIALDRGGKDAHYMEIIYLPLILSLVLPIVIIVVIIVLCIYCWKKYNARKERVNTAAVAHSPQNFELAMQNLRLTQQHPSVTAQHPPHPLHHEQQQQYPQQHHYHPFQGKGAQPVSSQYQLDSGQSYLGPSGHCGNHPQPTSADKTLSPSHQPYPDSGATLNQLSPSAPLNADQPSVSSYEHGEPAELPPSYDEVVTGTTGSYTQK